MGGLSLTEFASVRSRFRWVTVSAVLALGAACDRPPTSHPPPAETMMASDSPTNPATALIPPVPAPVGSPPQEEKPLLLEDGPSEQTASGGADNSRCQVCHVNFMAEVLTQVHAKANIGCAKCHGESDAHIADESWASGGNGTAPDVMFPKDKINRFCLGCHPRDKLDVKWHRDFLADTTGKIVCVDCHGAHRMVTRKCKWK